MLDFIAILLALAIAVAAWRGIVTPQLAARRDARRRREWPQNNLERLLATIGMHDQALVQFEQELLKSDLVAIGKIETRRPTVIHADFEGTLAGHPPGTNIAAGPFLWCFTSSERTAEFQRDQIVGAVANIGCFTLPSRELLEYARSNAAELMINPFLEFGYRYD